MTGNYPRPRATNGRVVLNSASTVHRREESTISSQVTARSAALAELSKKIIF